MTETIQDGIIIMENDKTVFVNRRIAEISGFSYEELRKMNPLSIVAPDDRQQAADQIRMMETGYEGGLRKLETWIIRKDGERRFVMGGSPQHRMQGPGTPSLSSPISRNSRIRRRHFCRVSRGSARWSKIFRMVS